MAKTILSEENPIKVNLENESSIGVSVSVDDTNYIPGYKEAEAQRRKNEKERIANETERVANETIRNANEIERETYFKDIQKRVANGEFKGEKGDKGDPGKDGTVSFNDLTEGQKASLKGDKGDPGEPGYTPIKGVDYFDGQDGKDGQDAPKYTAGTNIEITEDNVINCTATGGGGGGTLTEELDPTVPTHVKNITEADIEKWNSGTGGSGFDGDYNNLTNKPTELSQFNNDVGYITDYTESDPTVPKHVKDITEGNITSWNNKAEASAIPTKTSQLENDSGFITTVDGTIPTKTSQLTNDSGFITTDNNTTYSLSKEGSTIKLKGSDGSSSDVTVADAEFDSSNYSTSEAKIGTWVDGKTVYRRVFVLGKPSSQSLVYQHGIANFSTLVNAYGRYRRSNFVTWNTIPGNYTNWEAWFYDFTATTFTLKFSNNQWNNGVEDCYIVLEYTKTTD